MGVAKDKKNEDQASAEVVTMANHPIRCAGVDDGHFGIKIVTDGPDGKLKQSYVPSRVAAGASLIALSDNEDNLYTADDGQDYTVSSTMPHIDTRFPDYALSDINRVLVHHGLIVAGLGGENVRVVSGLPVEDYFVGSKPNADFIKRKVRNLLEKKVTNRNPNVVCANIVGHSVQAEAIAAFYDLLINADGSVNAEIKELVEGGSIGFIDVGGKTTDFAVVVNGGTSIDPARSGTSLLGALSLNIAVEQALKAEFNVSALTPAQVEQAVATGEFKVFGKVHPCSKIVDHEKTLLADQIIVSTKRKMRDASDLEKVFFVGGGSELLKDQLKDLFPHAEFVADPQYANARGMFKIAKHMMK